MPKKVKILDKLPENFAIRRAIGPREFKGIGNGGYFVLPSCFKGSKNLFIVDGEFIKKDSNESSGKECEKCSSENNVVYCSHFDVNICRACCNNCPLLRNLHKCPIRKHEV